MCKSCFAVVACVLCCWSIVAPAELPPELINAVEYQQKNKAKVMAEFRQQALRFKEQNNHAAAKEAKRKEDAVRSNKLLALKPIGTLGDAMPGTLEVGRVLETTQDGYWVSTHLPRLEPNKAVAFTASGQPVLVDVMEPILYPAKCVVQTDRKLKDGETINVRAVERNSVYAEIPQEQIAEATGLLRKTKP